jgi:membrane protein implicated in regulation of membrane protease activity
MHGSRRSFAAFALGSLATFSVAARATHYLGGPTWLWATFLAVGILLAMFYLYRYLSTWLGRGRRPK